MEMPPYPCSGLEPHGAVILYGLDGSYLNTVESSACFANWYCSFMGYTWHWRDGIDPDDPATWPDYQPPENPPADTAPVATT